MNVEQIRKELDLESYSLYKREDILLEELKKYKKGFAISYGFLDGTNRNYDYSQLDEELCSIKYKLKKLGLVKT